MGKNNKSNEQPKYNEIIINRMFSGEYLEDEGNIGHEIINLYKPDNGDEYYIYLLPYGDYSNDHGSEKTKIDSILLVRGRTKECVEVLAKATGIERVFDTDDFTKKGKDKSPYREIIEQKNAEFCEYFHFNGWKGLKNFTDSANNKINEFNHMGTTNYKDLEESRQEKKAKFQAGNLYQRNLIREKDIRYGGKLAYDLFSKNTTTPYNMSIFITYSAKEVRKVKEPFFLATNKFIEDNKLTKKSDKLYELDDQKFFLIERGRLSGSAAATFYCDKNEKDNYALLNTIINNSDELWGGEAGKYTPNEQEKDENFTFLSLIKKEYDELSYSNMFAYYFDKYNDLFKYFIENAKERNGQKILNCDVDFGNSFEVCREEKHIDILVKSKNDIFVIENKIKSGINGEKHNLYGDTIQNQLDNYVKYVEAEYNKLNKHYFIISPNYNKIVSSNFSKNVKNKYKIIYYSEIHRTFCDYFKEHPELLKNDMYLKDFLKAIEKHKKERDIDFEEIMKRKMQKLINESK